MQVLEMDYLKKEISRLREENLEDKDIIIKLNIEIENATEQIKHLENHVEIKEQGNNLEKGTNVLSIHQEIQMSNLKELMFPCNACERIFSSKNNLKTHMRSVHELHNLENKVSKFEKTILQQRTTLTQSILRLKGTELSERFQCNCRTPCRIFHHKHNWSKFKCEKFLAYFEDISKDSLVNIL